MKKLFISNVIYNKLHIKRFVTISEFRKYKVLLIIITVRKVTGFRNFSQCFSQKVTCADFYEALSNTPY